MYKDHNMVYNFSFPLLMFNFFHSMSTLLPDKVLVIKQTVYVYVCRSVGVCMCVCVHVGVRRGLHMSLVLPRGSPGWTACTFTTEPFQCPGFRSSLNSTLDGPFLIKLDFLQDLFVLV